MKKLPNILLNAMLLSTVAFSTFGAEIEPVGGSPSWLSPAALVPASAAAARGAAMAHVASTTSDYASATASAGSGAPYVTSSSTSTYASATAGAGSGASYATPSSELISVANIHGWFVPHGEYDWVNAWNINPETARPVVLEKAFDLTEPLAGLAIELLQTSKNAEDQAQALTASRAYIEKSALPQAIYVAGLDFARHPACTSEDKSLIARCLNNAIASAAHPFKEDAATFLEVLQSEGIIK